MLSTIGLWVVGAVALTVWMSGVDSGQALATTTARVAGNTAGVLIGAAPELFDGFKDAKDAATQPAPKRPSGTAGVVAR